MHLSLIYNDEVFQKYIKLANSDLHDISIADINLIYQFYTINSLPENTSLSEEQKKEIVALLERRLHGESVATIVRLKGFWKNNFITTKHTLDPRPETEIFIEYINKKYRNTYRTLSIMELGLGTGCLIISLLNDYPMCIGLGIEQSHDAFLVAKQNAQISKIAKGKFFKINWFNTDRVESIINKKKIDIMISNPPYVKSNTFSSLSRSAVISDPHCSIIGGITGVKHYRSIISIAEKYLSKNGILILEIDNSQKNVILKIALSYPFLQMEDRLYDLQGHCRCIVFKKK